MTKIIATVAAALLCGVLLPMSGGCAAKPTVTWHLNGQPHYAHPHEDWWHYQFAYHAGQDVYYEPYSRTYFWYADNAWEEGPELPSWIRLPGHETARIVQTRHPKPYMEHQTVASAGRPTWTPMPGSEHPIHATRDMVSMSENRGQMRLEAEQQAQAEAKSDQQAAGTEGDADEQAMGPTLEELAGQASAEGAGN